MDKPKLSSLGYQADKASEAITKRTGELFLAMNDKPKARPLKVQIEEAAGQIAEKIANGSSVELKRQADGNIRIYEVKKKILI